MTAGAPVGAVRVGTADGRSYPVVVERGALGRLGELVRSHAPAPTYAVVSDENVADLYGDVALEALAAEGSSTQLLTFPPGEASKSREEWVRLTDALLDAGAARDWVVVALGGGVAGDLAGFVAATCLRGLRIVQVPTSVVAMVDSAVGGKTGVDHPVGKNLVGAFHPPRLVVADPDVLETLPRERRAEGLAEAVKHGAILDAPYLDGIVEQARRLLDAEPDALERVVRRSVELKAAVVGADELEAGRRRILNFGHTIGHGIEAASGWRISHGAAVASGMVLEARLGERLGVTKAGTSARLAEAASALGLPGALPPGTDPEEVLRFARRDKKGPGRYVLLSEVGRVDPGEGWTHPVEPEAVREVLELPEAD